MRAEVIDWTPIQALMPCVTALLCVGLVLLALARTEREWVHWAFAAALSGLAVAQLGNGLSLLAAGEDDVLRWRRVAVAGEIVMPGAWLVFSLSFARANAGELLQHWRPGLLLTMLLTGLLLALAGSDALFRLAPGPGTGRTSVALGDLGRLYASVYLVAQVVILANLEQTLRHADEQTRWYLKFPLVGLGLLCSVFLYQMSDLLLYGVWHADLAWLSGAASGLACGLIGYGLLRRPIPHVQVYVSRRIVSGSLTFLIVGGLLTGTGLVAGIIRYSGLPGSVVLSVLFILLAVTGLVLVLLSAQLRQAVSRFVERHFFPHKYDYRARWLEVTEAIAASSGRDEIAWRLVQLVKGIFGARHVAVWMGPDADGDLWVRVAVHNVSGGGHRLRGGGEVRRWLEAQPGVCWAAEGAAPWQHVPAALRGSLEQCQAALVLPLRGGRQVIGWAVLGAPAGGRYTQQDADLLRCIAAQVGDRLQHLLLADRLALSREMEAFYQYSAFFLHDLKNFTATLSLVVQNAVRHGNNPEFQLAAMTTVGATVKKMTALIGTLGALSREPHPKLAPLNLNELVEEVLRSFQGAAMGQLAFEPGAVPLVRADREQLYQVLLNLILNAQEAIGEQGVIRIRTCATDGAAAIVVEDNGCGMDPATAAGLFRPFRTSKGRGLGIGLYQCRKIVAAHRGELDVDSEEGKGSRFVVRLPVLKPERVEAHA